MGIGLDPSYVPVGVVEHGLNVADDLLWCSTKADVHGGNRGNPDYWRVQMASKVTTVAFQELFNLGMAQSCEHTWILKVTDFQTMFQSMFDCSVAEVTQLRGAILTCDLPMISPCHDLRIQMA